MKTLPGTLRGDGDPFLSTRWSIILSAGQTDAPSATADTALSELCETYWPPLYTFVRNRGHAAHDAQDLVQSFFAYLIEHRIYARADRAKGSFRSFLLASLKNHLADARDRAQTLKRGGGRELLNLDEALIDETESLFQTHCHLGDTNHEDRLFELSWAETLVKGALGQLAEKYRAERRAGLFQELKTFLTGGVDPLPTYDELSTRLSIPASTLRSDVTRLRASYRAALRAEVQRTVETEADVEVELRELLRVLTRR